MPSTKFQQKKFLASFKIIGVCDILLKKHLENRIISTFYIEDNADSVQSVHHCVHFVNLRSYVSGCKVSGPSF